MKIVTYNVNGLRPRISQFGSLLKLLDSFDADIICFQETKVRRQELTSDLVIADGYESFFSCTSTSDRGRLGYSGVATFCRVKSAFSSSEVALPIAAEEGFTGLLEKAQTRKDERPKKMEGLEDFAMDELLKVDREGRCIITDHGHFVLFNIYGPRAECDDTERIQYKSKFYKIIQKRWEVLRREERRVFIVGDFNIAPAAIDRCDAGPDFEKNEFGRWFRSILVESGGPFYDVFRAKHPERREAYTCWSQSTGAEEFNYGSRIDHILSAGSCLHEEHNLQGNLVACHVNECDILMEYNRWKPGSTPRCGSLPLSRQEVTSTSCFIHRWKGGRSIKLEGSDHAPVYMSLVEIPDVPPHNTPSLSTRYLPWIHGLQQTLVSVLMKRNAEPVTTREMASSFSEKNILTGCSSDCKKRTYNTVGLSTKQSCEAFSSLNSEYESAVSEIEEQSTSSSGEAAFKTTIMLVNNDVGSISSTETKKKARKRLPSQLSLRSFFQKPQNHTDTSVNHHPTETTVVDDETIGSKQSLLKSRASTENQEELNADCSSMREKNNVALLEWQRIQQLMQNSIPLCKGHSEPCVARVVKKPGPNFGRRFYVCARAEGPTSNSEANCGHFKWAASKWRNK